MRTTPGASLRSGRWFGAIVILALPWVTQLDFGSASLRGLPGVAVVAEEVSPDLRPLGITVESLAERVTAALRRDSIPVLERSDALAVRRQPMLVIRLEAVKLPESSVFAWRLSLAVCQRVGLLGSEDSALAETWSATSSVGATSGPRLQRAFRGTLDDQVAQFVAAWKDANGTR
jgi:hypothetical protein